MDDEGVLAAIAHLGGERLDPALAAAAVVARTTARRGIEELRDVSLALINATEPGHLTQRLVRPLMEER